MDSHLFLLGRHDHAFQTKNKLAALVLLHAEDFLLLCRFMYSPLGGIIFIPLNRWLVESREYSKLKPRSLSNFTMVGPTRESVRTRRNGINTSEATES